MIGSRRKIILASVAALSARKTASAGQAQPPKKFEYEELRWVDEREDPSLTIETSELVAKVIDNTGLRRVHGRHPLDPEFSHYFGYHGIRALWRKDELRNIVTPFVSWLSLQRVKIEGVELDPIDSRALFGVGRGWPVHISASKGGVLLAVRKMPVSGVEYAIRLAGSGPDSIDFEVTFVVHKKVLPKAAFHASWPCYTSAWDQVRLYAPYGEPDHPTWEPFGEKESFVVGDMVNYDHKFSCRYVNRNENFVLVALVYEAILRPTARRSASRSSQTR
jgi:hypothetical protein